MKAEESATRELIQRLVGGSIRDERELDRLYRQLSKRFHPDLSGENGSRFIRIRELYESSKARLRERIIAERTDIAGRSEQSQGAVWRQKAAASAGASPKPVAERPFDPYFIITESGFDRSLEPRGCLYLSLRRFYSLGLQNFRIRSMKGLKRRNALILRSIFHWSYIYDPDFPPLFAAYTRHHLQFLSTTWEVKNYNYARRLYSDGISGFFNYQYSGRSGTAEIAEEKFSGAERVLLRCVGDDHPLVPLCSWFSAEIEKAPLFVTA